MSTATSRTFKSGNSEAVRIPRDLAFGPNVELTLTRSGDVLTIHPKRGNIQDLVHDLAHMPKPSAIGARDEILIPERDDL